MIAVDTSCLLLLLSPTASAPTDPATGKPITFAQDRMRMLVRDIEQNRTKILVPTPVLSEVLVHAGAATEQYYRILHKASVFRVVGFDSRAALELALTIRRAKANGDKRDGLTASWAKVKFDRQIVAIAKVEGARAVYTDDPDIQALARLSGLDAIGLAACPLPPEKRQPDIFDQQRTVVHAPPQNTP